MKRRMRLAAPSIAMLMLAACATPEYQQANTECGGQGLQHYPVVQQPQVVQRSRRVQVPDGSTVCETSTVENTSKHRHTAMTQTRSVCRPGMRPATEVYNETVMVDINQGGREAWVDQCTRNLCVQRFGNDRCKPAK